MKLQRRYNTLLCLTAFIACLSYCVADDDTSLLAVLSVIACGFAWYVSRGERPVTLPRWVVNVIMLAAIVNATHHVLVARGASYWVPGGNTAIVSTLSQFLVYILLIKLYDRRHPRDEAHILSLSIFIVVGAVLTSNMLIVGFFLLLFAPCVICASMLLQLVGGARIVDEWTTAADLRNDEPLLPDKPLPGFRRQLGVASVLAVVGTLVFATIAFVLMPRGLWKDVLGGFGRINEGYTVGFTDQARLGQEGLLKNAKSDRPILNVRLVSVINGQEEDVGELRGTLYLRGSIKDRYDRDTSTWRHLELPRTETSTPITETSPAHKVNLARDPQQRGQIILKQYTTLLRPMAPEGYYFTLWRPIDLQTNQNSSIATPGRDLVIRAAPRNSYRMTDPVDGYAITSAMEYSDAAEPARSDVSFDSEVVRQLAVSILQDRKLPLDPEERDAATNRRVALSFVDHLRTNFEYDPEMIAPNPGEDPIEMFLTRTRRGHCEYFASALVAMCHSVGLEARYVAGYLAAEFNQVTGVYVVRESNAHAWAEVRLAPGRWQTLDASPPEAINSIHRPPSGLMARLREWYDAINFTWSNAIVSFDVSKQDRLIRAPEGWADRMIQATSDTFRSFKPLSSDTSGVVRFVLIVGLVAASLVVGIRAWLNRNGRIRRRHKEDEILRTDPVMAKLLAQAGFYSDALDLLHRSDLPKPQHRPPATHAAKLAPENPAIAAALTTIANLYYTVRFGRRALSPDELTTANAALASLHEQLTRRGADAVAAARNDRDDPRAR